VRAQAEASSEAAAFLTPRGPVSFGAYDQHVTSATVQLREVGIAAGDVIVLIVEDGLACATVLHALIRLGAIVLPLNPRLPEDMRNAVIADTGCNYVVADKPVHVADIPFLAVETLLSDDQDAPVDAAAVDPHAPAILVLTSGSSGPPKAAALSLGNLLENARRSNANIPLVPGDRWILSLPLFHVSGLGVLFRCLEAGATVVVPEPGEALDAAITRAGVTLVSLVPTQLHRMLETATGRQALQQLKAILLGGSAVPRALVERACDLGLPLHTTYGMTEMASQIATTPPLNASDDPFNCCKPLAPDTVRIDGKGRILVRGATLFKGYFSRGQLNLPLEDGWFVTGDLGHFDDHGNLHVSGRADSMFIVGGENAQPEEIERVIINAPGVVQVRVVPVPDDEYGTVPVAFVAMHDASPPDTNALRAHARNHLPGFAVPRHVFPWPDPLPRGGIKPRKKDLIALAEEEIRRGR
jgi:O-succinylbenzoic acid--CoA ligase